MGKLAKLHLKFSNAWRACCGIPLHETRNEPRRIDDVRTFMDSPEEQRCKGCARSVELDELARARGRSTNWRALVAAGVAPAGAVIRSRATERDARSSFATTPVCVAAPADSRPTILAYLSKIETMLRDRPCSRSPRCLDVEYKRLRTRPNKKDPLKPLLPDPDRLCSECSAYVLVQRAQEKIIESQHDESMAEQDEERRAERASHADRARADEDGGL